MTDVTRLAFALGLPWFLGGLIMHAVVPVDVVARRSLVAGYGYLTGVLVLTLLMRALDGVGLRFSLDNLLYALVPAVVGGLLHAYRLGRPFGGILISEEFRHLGLGWKILTVGLVLLLIIRTSGLWLEVYWRPLFPWDAFMHWATKAKIYTATQSMPLFVDYDQWLSRAGEGVFTDYHPDYPITTPLLQTWMNLCLGRWDDALMNLPWVALYVAGGLAFFGQVRAAGLGPLAAMVFTYFLQSMPGLEVQVALAGYADIFMGIYWLAAVMAFYQWANNPRQSWQGGLAVTFAASCLLIKNEGLFWLLAFVQGLMAIWLPKRWFLLVASVGLLLISGILLVFPDHWVVAGHTLAELNLQYRPRALWPFLRNLFVFANWHLLFWMAGALIVTRLATGLMKSQPWPPPLFSLSMMIGSALVMLSVLFLFTTYASSSIDHTADGRFTLQIAPSLVFLSAILNVDIKELIKI